MKKVLFFATGLDEYLNGTYLKVESNTNISINDIVIDGATGKKMRTTGRIIDAQPEGDITCFTYTLIA